MLVAKDGAQAVELYEQRRTEIDLVVSDMIMPRMGGPECFAELRRSNPQVKVLLSSGYSEDNQASEILAAGAYGFLQKAYAVTEVLKYARHWIKRNASQKFDRA